MTATSIIAAERNDNLAAFEEAFAKLEGVTEEHVTTLQRARTTQGSTIPYPAIGDDVAQAAYTAAALRGLAEAIATLQGNARRKK